MFEKADQPGWAALIPIYTKSRRKPTTSVVG
jgi:hypothetical protein